jgi:hypothetical protein
MGQPEAIEFVADFEAAIWKTVRGNLPSVTLRGCVYHWAIALPGHKKTGRKGIDRKDVGRNIMQSFQYYCRFHYWN